MKEFLIMNYKKLDSIQSMPRKETATAQMIEFKARNGKLSPEQEAFHCGLEVGRHRVLVVTSADEAIEYVKDIFAL